MKLLLTTVNALVAVAATSLAAPALERSESVLVRAVIGGDTIDVTQFGHVRLLGIQIDAAFATAARDRLSSLALHRWVRLETEHESGQRKRRVALVVTGDDVCVNIELVREGLARVNARTALVRLNEFQQAEAEAQRLGKGMWGYTRPRSWPRSPSSTHRSARFANATSFITASTTGRSGFLSSSSRRAR